MHWIYSETYSLRFGRLKVKQSSFKIQIKVQGSATSTLPYVITAFH